MDAYNPRYARHYVLKDFGYEAQARLARAKVLVIGAGGLGCPVLQYLTASGIGEIGIIDHDVVAISNLQRQVLYGMDDVGKPKVKAAAMRLANLNPEIVITAYESAIDTSNALSIIADYDVVVDCTDNFASRYLINDACVLMQKPLVFGAVYQYEGQVGVFNSADENGLSANYRDLFESPPDPADVTDCNEAGVLGVLPGIIGIMQATETIKLVAKIGEVLRNKLLTFNILTSATFIVELSGHDNRKTSIPKDSAAFKVMDYEWFCGNRVSGITNLSAAEFKNRMMQPDTVVIDLRNVDEIPKAEFDCINIPLDSIEKMLDLSETNILLFCQSGKRSLQAAEKLLSHFGSTKKIGHLQRGITELFESKPRN